MDAKNATYASGIAIATSMASFVYLNNEIKGLKEEMDKLKQAVFRTGQVVSQGNAHTGPVINRLQSKLTEVEAKLEQNQMMMEKGTLPRKPYIRKTQRKPIEKASSSPSSITVIKDDDNEEDAIISRIKGNPN